MEPNGAGSQDNHQNDNRDQDQNNRQDNRQENRQDNRQAGEGANPLQALPGYVFSSATGVRKDCLTATEVMDLAIEMTRTSAEIYELVGDLAKSLAERSLGNQSAGHPLGRPHYRHLLEINAAIQEAERRIRLLESKIVKFKPEVFDAFLEECWAVLVTLREVGGNLAGIIESDGRISPSAAASGTLLQIMKRLETCSGKISGLPGTGMAVSYECLVETVFNLQRRAGDLVGKSAALPESGFA